MRIALILLALAATPAVAQLPVKPLNDLIVQQEQDFWTSYTSGNTAGLSRLLLPDFTNVEQEIWNRTQVLDFVKGFFTQCSLAPVKILDPKVTILSGDTATIVYHATETPTCGGHSMSGDTNISTVWLLRDGRWQMFLHTEYAIPPKS